MSVEIGKLKAIESLRCGVPNGDAVRLLQSNQTQIEARFCELLSRRDQPGFLIQGDFGSGNSHVLNVMREIALEQGFACSIVPVGKDVTLDSVPSLFRAAIRELRLPGKATGGSCAEIVDGLNFNSGKYLEFLKFYLNDDSDPIQMLFGATLQIYERYQIDPEILDEMLDFWDGGACKFREVKQLLRAVDLNSPGLVAPVESKIGMQRFKFVSDLLVAAGHAGWVVLIDEAELIAKLTRPKRAMSYPRLAALLGAPGFARIPNLVCVAATTGSVWYTLLQERNDREEIRQAYEFSKPELATLALDALDFLTRTEQNEYVRPANEEERRAIVDRIDSLYRDVYGAPPRRNGGSLPTSNMRALVKYAIASADLQRFYPQEDVALTAIQIEENLDEDTDYGGEDSVA